MLAARVCGSRAREGLYREDDDLNVVVSFDGNITEREFYYYLHESDFHIAGIPLNATPISDRETGTLREYMEDSEYLLNDLMGETNDAPKEIEPIEPTLTFYVAECMEFPVLGEYHGDIPTAEEAVKLYEAIPADRMHGIKGIGINLQDGSIYDGEIPLMSLGVIDMDMINHVQHYKESPLVQQAVADLSKAMQVTFRQTPEVQKEEVTPSTEQPASDHKEPTQVHSEPKSKPEQKRQEPPQPSRGNGKRESVLKALRERQNKIKEQEKSSEKQHDKSKDHKKGDIDL